MTTALRIIDAAALLAIRPETVIASVRRAIIQHAQGLVVAPPPLQMVFAEANGDLHVKVSIGFETGPHRVTAQNIRFTGLFAIEGGSDRRRSGPL